MTPPTKSTINFGSVKGGGVRIFEVPVFGEQMTFENRDTIYGASWRGKVKQAIAEREFEHL